jgi:hypothetical protein
MAFDITPVLSSLNFKEVKSLLDKQATFFWCWETWRVGQWMSWKRLIKRFCTVWFSVS